MPDVIAPAAAPAAAPDPGGMLRRALDLRAAGDAQSAYRALVGLAAAEPDNAAAWYHLGQALHEAQKPLAAALAFRKSDQLRPGVCETMSNLGWSLRLAGDYEEATALLDRCVESFPEAALPHCLLAQMLTIRGGNDEAIDEAGTAVGMEDKPLHRLALAFALLGAERWAEGFAEFEARIPLRIPEFLGYPYPRWHGEPCRRLFVQAEQGLGDAIMMLRFIPEAAGRCVRLDLYVPRELLRLAAALCADQPSVFVSPLPSPMPAADVFCPMMSLPFALGLGDAEIIAAARPPYVTGIAARAIDADLPALKVGIVWGGNAAHESEPLRAVPLADLARLAEIEGVQLYSLQLGPQADDLGALGLFGIIRDLGPHLADLADTAEILAGLDLLICRDTAIAHLAGAMGTRCWLLVNQRAPEWRWGRAAASPWYPSLRLFRRHENDPSWRDLIENDIAPELRRLVAGEPA